MFKNHRQLSCTVGLVALLGAGTANAQTPGQVDQLQVQINELQRQIAALKGRVKTTEKQVSTAPSATYTKASAPPPTATVKMSANNRPSICSADGENCIALTSRLHLDAGGLNLSPHSATGPQTSDSGVNARRARIGILGTFMKDWNYTLVYDFGGSSDGLPPTSGAPSSGLNNAYLSYTGFKPVTIEGGYMDTPYTLGEATSSNDMLFMERASSQVIATSIAAGDNRSAFGIRGNTDRLWAGAYLTGPTSGATHVGGTSSEQTGAFGRLSYQFLQDKNYSLHLGGNALFLLKPVGAAPGSNPSLTLSDRPELRIDPTSLLTTGAIANVEGAQVYSAEAAAGIGSFFVQGEYFNYTIDRMAGLPSLNFDGGYVEASYTLTGESRKYTPSSGAYSGITPANPFSRESGGWGAWEIAGRYSVIDLNDAFTPGVALASTSGVAGGTQTIWAAGLNWYLNRNVRIMFNYLHGDIEKTSGVAPLGADVGASFDAFAMRTQIAF